MQLGRYLQNEGLSMRQFADEIGVSVQAISRYVNEGRMPEKKILVKILKITNGRVRPDDFILEDRRL